MTTATSDLASPALAGSRPTLRCLVIANGGGLAMTALAVLSAVLYLWNLTASGFANSYYAAAALAASQSWSAWFFGSLDAGNFITVDKPPLATMLMGLSVRLFGLSSASILVPEALLGVGSVLLLFVIVRHQFGVLAGTVAGLAFAVTPVAALMFRYDHPDALLTFLMLASAYGLQRAIENGRHRWLALAGIALGLAFLTKYLQGFLVGPALALAYVVAANASLRHRIAGLVVLGAATLATAAAWVAAVTLTPADLRPFIGGSTNNSVLDLIFGYDGLGRILGGGFGAAAGAGVGGGGQGGANFSGTPGVLRLFNSEFGGQIAWLLPAAGLTLICGLWLTRRAGRTDVGRAGYLLWGGWLLIHALVFSFMSGIVHSYYAVAMAPAIAALLGAGMAALWQHRESFIARATAAAAVLVTAGLAALLLWRSPSFVPWLGPLIVVLGIAAALILLVPPARGWRLAMAGIALGLTAMLVGPTAYTFATTATAYNGSILSAGPTTTATDFLSGSERGGFGGPGQGFGDGGPGGFNGGAPPPGGGVGRGSNAAGSQTSTVLADFLTTNRGGATWIAAVNDAQEAAQLELQTNLPVMAMGGWSGSDPALTIDDLRADIAAGSLRYVILGGQGGGFGGFNGPGGFASDVTSWIVRHGTAVTVPGTSTTLYDLSSALSSRDVDPT